MLDTAIDGVKFGGDIAIVGGTTKLAGKLVLEGGVKKVLTKGDDVIKSNTAPGFKSKTSVGGEDNILDKYFGGKIKLKEHEGRSWNGHTKDLHVGLKVDDLKARIANEGKDMVTSYPSEKVAESVISEVIVKNEAEIIKWFEKSNPFSKKEFGAKLGIYTGYGVNKAGEKINMNKATVWLKKMDDGSIKIHTSYPVEKLKGE